MLRRAKTFLIDPGLSLLIIISSVGLLWGFGADRQAIIISLLLMGALLVMISASSVNITKRLDVDAKKMLAGRYWVHWHYDASFWRQYAPERWFTQTLQRRTPTLLLRLRMAFIPALLIGMIGFFVMHRSGTLLQTFQVAGSVCFAAFFMVLISTHMRYRAEQNTSYEGKVEVYIGIDGIYITAPQRHFLRLRAPSLQLNNVNLETGSPAFLVFDAQYILGSGKLTVATLRLPIPKERQREAESIAKRFRTEATNPSRVSKKTRLF